jgi:GH24 family phage-related lysozyme (muramidase)
VQRKKSFDAVRRILGRGFTRSEVHALDRAIDAAGPGAISSQESVSSVTSGTGTACQGRAVSAEGLALIKGFEGCAKVRRDGLVEAYPDPGTGGEPWTIGWGATGPGIGPGTIWTQAQCDARLATDVARHARDVCRVLGGAATTQGQFDALVSFHYNTGAIARATLTRLHRAGDFQAAAREFARWNRAGGRVLRGLSRRRRAEAQFYSGSA